MGESTKRGRPRVPPEEKREQVKIVLSVREREEIDGKAKRLGVSRSELVRRAVRAYDGMGE